MTVAEVPPTPAATSAPAPVPSLAVRARDAVTCEWTKFRSVRSTFWTLLVAVVTRQIFTVSRRGGDRKPAVRVVLDALAAETASPRPAAA